MKLKILKLKFLIFSNFDFPQIFRFTPDLTYEEDKINEQMIGRLYKTELNLIKKCIANRLALTNA